MAAFSDTQSRPSDGTILILSCSSAKCRKPSAPLPAIKRYDGVLFKVFRKAQREGRANRVHLAILSARFGLIGEHTKIPFYDQKMTKPRAAALAATVRYNLRKILAVRKFDRILINLGRDYSPLISEMPELKNALWASGSIGKRAATLKAWLVPHENAQ